ncbi:unnamed protein product [Paramecium primaurelia]|uniref:UBC core domain-containing protein n=1 Tax=Paramecium primaurelia TaxID=5886 RepID=A0A8S1PQF1_PARPR|nr:unnamed protein product [Paramecium primaurelia]
MIKRLEKEFEDVQSAIDEGIIENMTVQVQYENNSANYTKWNVVIYGRENTIWQGGEFSGILEFPQSYPATSPVYTWKVYSKNRFMHMNIYSSGKTCIDILNDKIGYTPARTCVEILKALEDFLYRPNPKSPTNSELAKIFEKDLPQYEKMVREFVQKYMEEKKQSEKN